MGYFSVQSRKEGKPLIYSNVLYDSADRDDELSGFSIGDSIIISLDIDTETAKMIQDKGLAQGIVEEHFLRSEVKAERLKVEIEFRIIKRSHLVMRDWMTNKFGFRSSGTLIYIEAVSEEAEKLFLELQNLFDARAAY